MRSLPLSPRAGVLAVALTCASVAAVPRTVVAANGAPSQRPGILRRLLANRMGRVEQQNATAAGTPATMCGAAPNAGFRIVTFGAGSKAAVWYPTTAAETPFTYANGTASAVARDAPPADCGRVPLVLFSHGFGGCSLQSLFLTETLARHGYVVAAPDHGDARCRVDRPATGAAFARPDAPFRDPEQWSERTYADRADDLAALLRAVIADPALGAVVDEQRIGVAGHSLGGYTALGVAGGWPGWKLPQIRAALLLSPYVAPFAAHHRIAEVHVPLMFQGGTRDLGITPSLRRPGGAYEQTAPPKCYVELDGVGHLGWTNAACRSASIRGCVAGNGTAALVDRYALAFLDRYLKGDPDASVLHARALALADLRCAE